MIEGGVVCSVCGHRADDWAPGPGGRPRASCEKCGSLERHRFLVLFLAASIAARATGSAILDVAPSRQLTGILRALSPSGYVSIDFDPDADGRIVDLTASLTDLPFADRSFGLLVCYHVLEHIPEDHLAMAEIARTLTSNGIAVVQVPWRRGTETDEDPSASVEERVRRFGQADHVRYYGRDFVPRLEAAGLHVLQIEPRDLLDEPMLEPIGVLATEAIWLCATSAGVLPSVEDLRSEMNAWIAGVLAISASPRALEARVAELERALDRAQAGTRRWKKESARWQKRYETLRNRRPVRVMSAISRPFR